MTEQVHVDAGRLIPPHIADPESHGVGDIVQEHTYWIGVTQDCPIENILCAGLCFPKLTERHIPDPVSPGEFKREGLIGAMVRLTKERFDTLAARIPTLVVRPTGLRLPDAGDIHANDIAGQPPKFHARVVKIPSRADIEEARKNRVPSVAFVPQTNDIPVARYLFCELHDDGQRGNYYPDSVEKTGLTWPEEAAAGASSTPAPQPKRRGRPPKAAAPVVEVPNDLTS